MESAFSFSDSNLLWRHSDLLEKIGIAICGQVLAEGMIVKTEEFELKYNVSRSVVRETVRVLESMGLVSSRRRVGVLILAPTSWNVYDPKVIKWRLASSDRITQLRSLTELRLAIEPEAARLAAIRAPLITGTHLVELSNRMQKVGQTGDQELFLRLDIDFHRSVLSSSGNEMFAKLDRLVAEVLIGRTNYGLMPVHPHEEPLQLHSDVASAIQKGDADFAYHTMRAIMEGTLNEMSILWKHINQDSSNKRHSKS